MSIKFNRQRSKPQRALLNARIKVKKYRMFLEQLKTKLENSEPVSRKELLAQLMEIL